MGAVEPHVDDGAVCIADGNGITLTLGVPADVVLLQGDVAQPAVLAQRPHDRFVGPKVLRPLLDEGLPDRRTRLVRCSRRLACRRPQGRSRHAEAIAQGKKGFLKPPTGGLHDEIEGAALAAAGETAPAPGFLVKGERRGAVVMEGTARRYPAVGGRLLRFQTLEQHGTITHPFQDGLFVLFPGVLR